jgi:glucosyl-3-phosphoglycerate synthase
MPADPTRRALEWAAARSFHHGDFDADRLRDERRARVSVCVPAREEARTIGHIVATLVSLRERGVVDEVVVIDADSTDGTAEIAARAGANVRRQQELLPELGPVLGKGDALWRSLSVLSGEVLCFVDADTRDFAAHFVCGLLGPLVLGADAEFVKGFYRRPFSSGELRLAHGGGRVNDLTARPLLNRFYPELSAVRQPLAGEFAARRALLERLPFLTGYGVEIGLLIDAHGAVGLEGLAQVDLGVRQNAHQPLTALGPMASAVLGAVVRRLEHAGRLAPGASTDAFVTSDLAVRELELVERPPYGSIGSRRSPSARRSSAGTSSDPSSAARTAR